MFNMVLHDDLSDQSLQILHPEFLKKEKYIDVINWSSERGKRHKESLKNINNRSTAHEDTDSERVLHLS